MSKLQTRSIAIALAAVLLAFLFGIRVGHPTEGMGTVLGSAKSSLVVYKKGQTTDYQSKIIAVTNDGKVALAIASGFNGKQVNLSLGDRYESVVKENVRGKLLMVLPFLGYIAGVVGQ